MSLDVLSHAGHAHAHQDADFDLLNLLTAPIQPASRHRRREAPLDPLLLAAAIQVGPHITRHHYHHDIGGGVTPEQPIATVETVESPVETASPVTAKHKYSSKQAPRSQRLRLENKENIRSPLQSSGNLPRRSRGLSLPQTCPSTQAQPPALPSPSTSPVTTTRPAQIIRNLAPAPVVVQCMARTRIPTPYGPAFLHLYKNNVDDKEHLAIVADSAQLEAAPDAPLSPLFIRSKTLEARWSDDETELDRLTRGAYVGRLSPSVHVASAPSQLSNASSSASTSGALPPLVRIHSECFTGETIGSMRCDCGEQLDEALRLISLPPSVTSSGRGAVIYLRQEGRGIGLLSKIRAYNLQDMGHDTVQANLLLGHGADERRYDVAAAILKDLGLDQGIELLTNNPDKVESLEKEGIKVAQRRAMVPRSWQQHSHSHSHVHRQTEVTSVESLRMAGVTMIGGSVTHGPELEKYLRTKVERMGHMLDLPSN